MTEDDFKKGWERLENGFRGMRAPAHRKAYFELLHDMSEVSFGRIIDRVLLEFSSIPQPDEFNRIYHDLTYWDASEFFSDWNHAYFACTGEMYDGRGLWPPDPYPPAHIRKWLKERQLKADVEEAAWLCRRLEIREIGLQKGGRRAVQKELKAMAERGCLEGRSMTEYLEGRLSIHDYPLGYRKPDMPDRMPPGELQRLIKQMDAQLARIPKEQPDTQTLAAIRAQARREQEAAMEGAPF